MLGLTLGGVLFVDLDSIGNELNICHKVLVGLSNFTNSHVLASDEGLLGLVSLFIRHLGHLDLPASSDNSVLSRAQVPDNDLSVDTSSNDDIVVVGVEFNSSHFYGRFQNIVEHNNVTVLEVHNKDISAITLATVLTPGVEVRLLDQRHSH